jgi:O-antigen ligase
MDPILILGLIVGICSIGMLFFIGLKRPTTLIFLLIFFLPFERIPSIDIGGPTLKINHLIGLFVILLGLVVLIKNRLSKNTIAVIGLMLLLIATMLLSSLDAHLLGRSLLFSALNIFTILLCGSVFVLVGKKDWSLVEKAIIYSGWVVIIFSLWQFFGDLIGLPLSITGLIEGYSKATFGFPRVQAFSKEPLYLGNFLFLPLGLAVAKLLSGERQVKIWLFTGGLLFTLLLTISRGAYLGLLVFVVVMALFSAKKVLTFPIIASTIIGLALIGGIFYGVINNLGPEIKERFINHITIQDYTKTESTVVRLSASKYALAAWSEHPLLGIGPGNYGGYTTNYDAGDPSTLDIVNNEYLEILAENGIVGLGLMIILICVVLSRTIILLRQPGQENEKMILVGLNSGLIAMLAQYAFFSTFAIIHIWVMFGLVLALQKILLEKHDN